MIIIHKGELIDTTIEQNITTKSNYGFDVMCLFKKGSYKEDPADGKQAIHMWHNINQVHSLYEDWESRSKIAFESDILLGGGWRYIDQIEVVTITPAKKLHTNYCQAIFLENGHNDP